MLFARNNPARPALAHPAMETIVASAAEMLDPAQQEALDRHLARCKACRTVAEKQRAVWRALDVFEAADVPQNFDRRLYATISEREQRPWWKVATNFPFGRTAIPVAVAGLALCAVFLMPVPATFSVLPAATPHSSVEQKIDVDQVERTLDDLDMLKQLTSSPADTAMSAAESQS